MKKIIFVLIAILGIFLTSNAEDRCTVNDDITVEISNGYALVKGSEYGKATVKVTAKATKKTYATVYVWVNAIDRTSGCIIDTEKIQINLFNETSDSNTATFDNLTPGVYYKVSIDRASCN